MGLLCQTGYGNTAMPEMNANSVRNSTLASDTVKRKASCHTFLGFTSSSAGYHFWAFCDCWGVSPSAFPPFFFELPGLLASGDADIAV